MRAIFVLLAVALFVVLGAAAKCGDNEEFQRCGTGCERTCNNGDDWDKPCALPCVDRCFCLDGFLRDSSGACVRAWRCSPSL